MNPQNNPHNEPLALLDIRGLLIRLYNTITSGERIADEQGNLVPTANNATAEAMSRIFQPLFEQYPPRRVICCWDGGNDYRTLLFKDYKKKRRERDTKEDKIKSEQLQLMMEQVKRLTAYLAVRHFRVSGQEADDLIALFCEKLPARQLLVKTVDEDLIQLAGSHRNVVVNLVRTDTYYGYPPDGMAGALSDHHKGIPIRFIRLYKSIVGDTSDGYPGVPGIGQKGFEALAEAYGWDGMEQIQACVESQDYSMLEAALKAVPDDKQLQKLYGHQPEWRMSWNLANAHPEVCYGSRQGKIVKPELYTRLPLGGKFSSLLQEYGAFDLLPVFQQWLATEHLLDAGKHETLRSLAPEIAKSPLVAYDFESYDTLCHAPFQEAARGGGKGYVDVLSQRLTGLSFCIGENLSRSYYVPVCHANTHNLNDQWAKWCLDLFSYHPVSVVQNANFEVSVALTSLSHEVSAPLDTAITASYVDENELPGLKDRAMTVFRYRQTTYKEVTGGRGMNELSGPEVLEYGCDDSLVSAHLLDTDRLIMQLEGTWDFYLENEVEPVQDDVRNFITGTCVDLDYLAVAAEEDAEKVSQCTAEVRKHLQAHCVSPDPDKRQAYATTLLDEWWQVEGRKLQKKVKEGALTQEQVNAKYQAGWVNIWNSCAYTPYTETAKDIKFSPTAKNLSAVTALLGAAPIDRNSKRALNDWLHENEDLLETSLYGKKFMSGLSAAAGDLAQPKNRTGEAYESFKTLCVTILEDLGGHKGEVESSGTDLNFGSSIQMQSLLYGMLGLPVRRRSKVNKGTFRDIHELKGAPATGNKAISTALVYDVVDPEDWRMPVLQNYKKIVACQQAHSLYYSKYPLWVHPVDGRIHPQLKNCGTVTRRPSGTAPNVLQVSKKDDAKIRKAYVTPSDDYCYVCLDFAGQELRLTASESKDPVMLDAYLSENKKDIHSLTASGIAHILLPRNEEGFRLPQFSHPMSYEVYMEHRNGEEFGKAFNKVRNDFSKAVNFLIIYVGSATTLAENLNIPIDLAEQIMNNTFRLYSRLQPWQQEVIEYARRYGYVKTAYGNRRHISSDIHSPERGLRSRAERQAVNMLAQGCLPAGSRVETRDNGLVPIEELVGKTAHVWTGRTWKEATGLVRGEAHLFEVEFDSGLSIVCDNRHKFKDPNGNWVDFEQLEVGDWVAQRDTPNMLDREYSVDWPFVVGYVIGDGCLREYPEFDRRRGTKASRFSVSLHAGKVKEPLLKEIQSFLSSEGVEMAWRVTPAGSDKQEKYRLESYAKSVFAVFSSFSLTTANALDKRVPEWVFRSSPEVRKSFLQGYAMSDGSRQTRQPSWHTPNRLLLTEVAALCESLGVGTSLGTTETGYILRCVEQMPYPKVHLQKKLQGLGIEVKSEKDDCERISERRAMLDPEAQLTQRVARRIIHRYLPGEEVYRYSRVVSITKVGGPKQQTYTLEVDDPLHQYSAAGMINKNCAADILKIVRQQMRQRKMYDRYKLQAVKPIYDEMAACVPIAAAPEYILEMKEVMEITPPGHAVPMAMEAEIGLTSWGAKSGVPVLTPEGIAEWLREKQQENNDG